MFRIAAALALVLTLAACDAVNTLTDGFKHAKAVEKDLEGSTGVKPNVGFNWNNGRLTSVTVTFPRLVELKPLHELAEAARASVGREFKQTPDNILLAFAVPQIGSPTARHRDQFGSSCTILPPTIVISDVVSAIFVSSTVSGSALSTARSASLPGSSEPFRSSSKVR